MAASAFNIEEPAAPMTAMTVSNQERQKHVVVELTVVAQGSKLNVKDTSLILAHTANADSVTTAEVTIETGLRPVRLVIAKDLDGGLGGRGAAQGLGFALVVAEGLTDLVGRGGGLALEAQAHASSVAVHDRNAVAGGRDTETILLDKRSTGLVETAQDLASFGLKLILLARDEGHDIVDDIHARNTGVASTRDGLHGDDGDGGDGTEGGLEGGKGDDEADDGAVGVAHKEALVKLADGTLVRDEVEMRKVDSGNDERDEGIASVVLCVGEDGDIGLDELEL